MKIVVQKSANRNRRLYVVLPYGIEYGAIKKHSSKKPVRTRRQTEVPARQRSRNQFMFKGLTAVKEVSHEDES